MARFLLGSLILLVTLPAAATAADLSRYRGFQLGMSLPAIAKEAGLEPSAAKTIHRRPALIQELQWHPRPLGPSSRTEAVDAVIFSFYDGNLFRIAVQYGRYETEGLTANDFVEAISATYGPAVRPAANVTSNQGPYGDQEEVLARWDHPEYRWELISSSYGPSFKLIGVVNTLDTQAQAANLESRRLDDLEAPQRDAARIANEEESAKAKLEKARLVNKPTFRM